MSDPREIVQRNRTLASMMEIDPYAETVYGWLFRYDVDTEATRPLTDPATVVKRPEAQRAWRMWATMLQPRDLDRQHHGIREAYDRFQLENFAPDPSAAIERGSADGVPYLKAVCPGEGPVLLHLHGGGYLIGSAEGSVGLASRLAAAVGGACVVPGYRKAPEHPYPSALEDALAVYKWLLAQGSRPCAGAADRRVGRRRVGRGTGHTAAGCLQGTDPRDPLASPIYGSFGGLPPLLVQVAENEALYADATRMADAARRDGVSVELDTYSDTVHVFQMFDFLPESTAALDRIAEFAVTVSR